MYCTCLIKHHTMKTYGGVEVERHALVTSTFDGDEWSASHPCRFILLDGDSVLIG
jgi:hypothetical protein